MKKVYQLAAIILVFFALSIQVQASDAAVIADKIVKISTDIKWTKKIDKTVDQIVIGVVGDAAVAAQLEKLAANDDKKSFKVVSKDFSDDLSDCNLIYTSTQELSELAKVLKQAGRAKLVTISNAKDFARYGVMINFIEQDSKLKLEVNKMVLDEAGIELSNKILKDAIII